MRRLVRVLLLAVLLLPRAANAAGASRGARAAAHPLHTTLTELAFDARTGTVTATVRAFAEDFAPAAARAAGVADAPDHAVNERAAAAYLGARLAVTGRDGRPLRFAWCGVRAQAGVVWLCLRASAPTGLAGARVVARQLFEVFSDQVNIVQATYDGGRRSTLFTAGDGPKTLP